MDDEVIDIEDYEVKETGIIVDDDLDDENDFRESYSGSSGSTYSNSRSFSLYANPELLIVVAVVIILVLVFILTFC